MVPRCEDSSINHPLGHLPRLLVLWTERERQRRDAKRAPVVHGEQEIREKEGRLDFQKGGRETMTELDECLVPQTGHRRFIHFRAAWATPVDSLPERQSKGLEQAGRHWLTRDLVSFPFCFPRGPGKSTR